jgi:hypothetical protein
VFKFFLNISKCVLFFERSDIQGSGHEAAVFWAVTPCYTA